MNPIQPFFVFATDQYHKQPVMNGGISHFYHFRQNCSGFEKNSAIPDGCVDIYFEKGSSGIQARVCGTVLERTILDSKAEFEYFGIRFLPGVLPANLNAEMKDLISKELDLADVIQNKDLVKRIEEASDWKECIRLFVEDYTTTTRKISPTAPGSTQKRLADYLIQIMVTAGDSTRIQDLSDKTGYSVRYINMILDQYTGLNPKTFERIIKIQNAVHHINHHQEELLTNIGSDAGYFDQAHFIKEFKKHISMTPTEYRNLVRDNFYLKRLNIDPVMENGFTGV